jgi:hypothetical protein
MKAVPPPANLAHARRAVAVHAVFADDALSSRAVVRRDALSAELDIGALLAPPEGAFVLADVPAPGDRSVVLPSASGVTHVKVVVDGLLAGTPVRLEVWSPATGAVRLPAGLDDVLVQSVSVYALDVDPFAATAAGVDVEHVATKAARAPGG